MTICLSMIVKNEAHCITKCLESIKPYIDYWVISDTGSTDNTADVIQECLKGIPGELHQHEWIDFSTNRNNALQLAKDRADYTLIIDADDYLVVNDPNVFQSLREEAYQINIQHSTISYARVQLVKNSIPAQYKGVLHEYLELPLSVQLAAKILPDCHMVFGASGSRSQNPLKFVHDAEVLEKAILKEPENVRYVFYCAQSYRDAGEQEKALNYYAKRSKMGGWAEEVYVSLLEAAKLVECLTLDVNSVESAYIQAYNYLPTRIESLCYLASFCRRQGYFEKAYLYAKMGSLVQQPENGLFVEPDCYNWKIQDELAIAAFYVGKKEEARQINSKLLKRNDVLGENRNRIIKNLQFC